MVDDNVDEHTRAERVRGLGEFAKLVNAGGALVELHQRGIHRRQIQRGVGAAETAKTRVSRGRGMHRQQMNDAAAKLIDNERKLAREVAEFSGRRQRGVAFGFECLELGFQFFIGRGGESFGRAKQAGEGAVNRVGGAREIGVHGNAHVRAVRPVLPVFFVEQIRLGFEIAHFGQRQFDLPAVGGGLHGHIAPGSVGDDGPAGVGGNDFAAARGGAAEIGAQAGATVFCAAEFFRRGGEKDFIADETQQAFAGGRSHDGMVWFHRQKF